MKKKILISLSLLLVVFLNSISIVNATANNNRTKFTRGVSNTCYTVNNNAGSYTKMINAAARSWTVLDNKIKNTAVSSTKGSHIDFYAYTNSQNQYLDDETIAYTMYFDDKANIIYTTSEFSGPEKDWYYTDIVLNKSLNNLVTQGVIAHEMGHAYGLVHLYNRYSIMWPYGQTMLVSTPQQTDNASINILY